jgi:hypothetical protein
MILKRERMRPALAGRGGGPRLGQYGGNRVWINRRKAQTIFVQDFRPPTTASPQASYANLEPTKRATLGDFKRERGCLLVYFIIRTAIDKPAVSILKPVEIPQASVRPMRLVCEDIFVFNARIDEKNLLSFGKEANSILSESFKWLAIRRRKIWQDERNAGDVGALPTIGGIVREHRKVVMIEPHASDFGRATATIHEGDGGVRYFVNVPVLNGNYDSNPRSFRV